MMDTHILKIPKSEFLETISCQMTSSALTCFIVYFNSKLRLFRGTRVFLDDSCSPLLQAVSLDSGAIQLL